MWISLELTTGIMGVVAIAACLALAVALYRVTTVSTTARMLGFLLLIEAVTLGTAGYIENILGISEEFYELHPLYIKISFIIHTLGDCAFVAFYPPFLAAALQTKLTRPFAGKRMRIGLAIASVVMFFAVNLSPLEMGATVLYLMLSVLFGYALVAAIHAWYVAPAGAARSRAGVFVLAFGLRDICWGFVYISAILRIMDGTYATAEDPIWVYTIYALGTLLYVPLIAYGILRTKLFDIDLRIRWTIKQSTLAATIVAIMFVLSEGAERLLSADLGNVGGLMVAALVVFVLTPLQRFAERVASVAMPNTKNTPEYTSFRKMQVYEEALNEAQIEEGVSEKERALLVRLRDSLGISESDAEAIEGELQSRLPSFG